MSRFLTLVVILLLTAGAALGTGCGQDSPVGTYEWSSGELTMLRNLTLVLSEDGTFSLTGPSSLFEEEWDVHGSWEQDGSTVRLIAVEGDETAIEIAQYREGQLSWDGVVWKKQ